MPPNPPSNAHGFAMRSMSLRDMQIPKSEKKISWPPPSQILGTPLLPPPRNLSNPLNKLNTMHGNNPNPSRKNPKHFRKHLHPSQKFKLRPGKISTSLKNSYPDPSPFAKIAYIHHCMIQSQTLELDLNPFPKNPNPL